MDKAVVLAGKHRKADRQKKQQPAVVGSDIDTLAAEVRSLNILQDATRLAMSCPTQCSDAAQWKRWHLLALCMPIGAGHLRSYGMKLSTDMWRITGQACAPASAGAHAPGSRPETGRLSRLPLVPVQH